MLKLYLNHAPQSYCFVDPDTGYKYREPTKDALITRILNYRTQNDLPRIEGLDAVLENYWCTLPENYGKCQPTNLKRGWLPALRGGITILTKVLFEKFASTDLAERRAAICLKCPYNIFPDKGPFTIWADRLAEHATDGRKVSTHDKLGNCEVCTCNLRAKIWFGGKIELPPDQVEQLRALDKDNDIRCWQLDEIDSQKK